MYNVKFCMNRGNRLYQEDCVYIDGEVFQEDYIDCPVSIVLKSESVITAVCDGMGGLSDGEKASRFVCERLGRLKGSSSEIELQQKLYSIQKEFERSGLSYSGTTIAGVYIKGRESFIFNAGDSRVYKYTSEKLLYLSHDHSYVQYLVDQGIISYEEAFYHPQKNIVEFGIGDVFSDLWRMGKRPFVKKDFLKKDEAYLLCSDGLSDYIPDRRIHFLLYPDPFKNFSRLLDELEKIKGDNYSIILIRFSDQPYS